MNLCVNARDAMPQGGKLTIAAEHKVLDETYARMHPDARPGRYVVLRVIDTGMGIAPEILDRIFDPFFTTKEIGKGTGLGLATVLGIVKSHGGFLAVTSEVAKGTQFSVYLPAAETGAPGAQEEKQRPARCGHGELILVVDDEAPIRAVMTAVLEAHGYRVQAVQEGAEALGFYAQHREEVQLIITDMMMPGMDGAATIRALRQINPTVRVLATSGMAGRPSPASLTQAAGAQGFLAKPYTSEELVTAVREVLGSR
jgi:CheY-like chemotaxis protein